MRVLLLLPTTSYKTQDFLDAAGRLGAEVVVGSDSKQALEELAPGHTLRVSFRYPERSLGAIRKLHATRPFDAVIGADDEAAVLAAMTAEALGLRHTRPDAARVTRDKLALRRALVARGLRVPAFRTFDVNVPPEESARSVAFPAVLKPLSLSASRGVLRANDPAEFVTAFRRITAILARPDARDRGGDTTRILVEDYMPGAEVALEGLLQDGRLRPLALFDKPDPLEGPTFPETIYVTPSRLPETIRAAIVEEVERGCAAIGLTEGPVHAELRVAGTVPTIIEVAARTIGGLCARALRFGVGISLEELVLRHALGLETNTLERERKAAGVVMLPVPTAGIVRGVRGLDAARAVPGVEEVKLTVHRGAAVEPLPEGHRYLGFIFAREAEPDAVERALRRAWALLEFDIEAPAGDQRRSEG